MGNAIHRMNIHFTDSDWRNILSVNHNDISGEGTVIIEALGNDTTGWVIIDSSLRKNKWKFSIIEISILFRLRRIRSSGDLDTEAAYWAADIDQFVKDMMGRIPVGRVNPWCELVIDLLTFLNLIIFIHNLILVRK